MTLPRHPLDPWASDPEPDDIDPDPWDVEGDPDWDHGAQDRYDRSVYGP